ncbi:MAG: transglycosylase SLT domain-containing protein [Hyphomicrobiales bacterium]|nr:transglycosylase SLT domain-containing protein [Hyphomicrobiales bacterium]
MRCRDRRAGRSIWAVALVGLCCSKPGVAQADAASCEAQMVLASRKYDVPLGVLYAVGLTETGRKGSLDAFAMNIDGRPVYPGSLDAALATYDRAARAGARLIDIGCMQINRKFHGAHFKSVAEMFDPPLNVAYAARFLKELRAREPSWTLAVARYHAGPNNNPAQKRYVCAVIANMVASGFGQWTAPARAFCTSQSSAGDQ